MNRVRVRPEIWAVLASIVLLAALTWAVTPPAHGPGPLAGMLPGGALMTVETADFGALVADWNGSPQQRAWLASANYSAFSNSRLFSRLADAQSGFMDAAKTSIDGDFLKQIAGKESIFAWYDIGNLEFLYLSRLPHDRLAKLSLMAQRGSFARREVPGTTFYVRTSTGAAAATSGDSSAANEEQEETGSEAVDQPRTVAFAVRGDWLILATREDLLAGSLQLMAASGGGKVSAESQAAAAWYAAASAAGPAHHGDLHMLLDLQALAKTPQFRTYWIQRNVTATRQYRAAVVDLYREPTQFREERVLLPMQPEVAGVAQPDLGALEGMVPERAGVYRASANPGVEEALNALRDKVLVREPSTAGETTGSPDPQVAVTSAGAAGDLDSRIDAPAPEPEAAREQFAELRQALGAAGTDSMLTVDRTDAPGSGDPFVHIHSAVVLHSASPWNGDVLASALLAGVRPRLTTATLGVAWTEATSPGGNYRTLGAPYPVCLAVKGSLAILTTDPATMEDILQRPTAPPATAASARLLAGFRHDQERSNFRRLTADLNLAPGDASSPAADGPSTQGSSPETPAPVDLFRDNLPSLSDSFQAMTSERFTEARDGATVHQTVLYRWNQPSASR